MTQTLPPLGAHLAALLQQRGIIQSDMAERLGVTHNTLRQDLGKSRFFPDDLIALCKHVGLPTDLDALATQYTFTAKIRPRGMRRIMTRADDVSPRDLMTQYMDAIRPTFVSSSVFLSRILQTCADSSLLTVFISDAIPSHWRHEHPDKHALQHLLGAIRRGTRIIYLFPAESVWTNLAKWNAGAISPSHILHEFNRFRRRLEHVAQERTEWQGVNLEEHLMILPHTCILLCTPQTQRFFIAEGHKAMYGAEAMPLASGRASIPGLYPDYPIIPLPPKQTGLLANTFENALFRAKEDGSTQGIANTVLRTFFGI